MNMSYMYIVSMIVRTLFICFYSDSLYSSIVFLYSNNCMFSVILCGYSMIFVLCILCKIIDLNKKFSIMFCCLFISFPKHSNNYFHLFQLINMVSICSFQAEKFEIQTNQMGLVKSSIFHQRCIFFRRYIHLHTFTIQSTN